MSDDLADKLAVVQQKYQRLVWRFAAVVFLLTFATIFLCRYYFFDIDIQKQDFLTVPVYVVLYGLTLAVAVVLIIFPLKLHLYVVFAFVWGIVHLIEGRSILGLFFYVLAGAAAYQVGLFRKNKAVRISMYCICLVGATTAQVMYTSLPVGALFLRYLEYLVGIGFGVLLFLPEIKKMRSERKEAVLHLESAQFTKRDALMLQKVLAGDKYEAIAKDLGVAEVTLKKRLRGAFNSLGVDDRVSFLARYSNYTVTYEEAC
jgi:hypothetical protein